MTNHQNGNYNEFFKIFSKPIITTLSEGLDASICKNIECAFENFSIIEDAEALKEDKAIYKIDFVSINKQGHLAMLIPEEFWATVSDILTGGKGKDAYKGSLSELETNSVKKIMTDLFKNIESEFKLAFTNDLIFSSESEIILKESENYFINTEDAFFDFDIKANIKLNDEMEFEIDLLFSKVIIEHLMEELGFSNSGVRKVQRNNIDLNCLADVGINITAELGHAQVPIKYAMELVSGSIVELDTQNNADIKIYANGVEFAYAQVVAIEDYFGLKITKIISPKERLNAIK